MKEIEEVEEIICDINFRNMEIDEPKAIRSEITSKIMRNAFDHIFEETHCLFVPDIEGAGYNALIQKYGDEYMWEFQDNNHLDEWYCERRLVDLEKLEKIIACVENKSLKWLAFPYASAPFRDYDPEAKWLWNEIKKADGYSLFLSRAGMEDKITQGYISISDWGSFECLVYTLAEKVPSLAFELILLNKKGKEMLSEGIKALQERCHYWLLKQGFVSNLVSYHDSMRSYSDTLINLHAIETFMSFNFFKKRVPKDFRNTISAINDLFSECLLTDFSLPIGESLANVTYVTNKEVLSLTIPINTTNPNHPKALGEIKLDFEVSMTGNELSQALKGASPDEISQYLLDCYNKVGYTQDGVFSEKHLRLKEITWLYQNQEIPLMA